ncbi:MAG TPA: DMT family transporter [Jiangellaceae bacterium]|nr:DMT family transporter [Jiangellaceae bacterium]
MVILFSLVAAALYGSGDFLGGSASRRAAPFAVLLVSTPIGLAVLMAVAMSTPGTPTWAALAWGTTAGLAAGIGLSILYGALAAGPMSVVAPVSALTSAMVPVGYAVATGEYLDPLVYVGVALCLAAIAMVSLESGERPGRLRAGRGAVLAVASGVGFGLFFILIRHTDPDSGAWPLVGSRAAAVAVAVVAVLALRVPLSGTRAVLWLAIPAGLFDALGNLSYLLATRAGLLSLSAVITSLYPSVTVLLARIVYTERLRRIQGLGLLVAGVGVAVLAV